eukprot:7050837-Alexandrium_andersonii.AAC.1
MADAAAPTIHVDPPNDGRLTEVEGLVEAWARGLPRQPPGAAAAAAENAAVATLAGWPTETATRLWKPLAEWLQNFTLDAARDGPTDDSWDAEIAKWFLEQAGAP